MFVGCMYTRIVHVFYRHRPRHQHKDKTNDKHDLKKNNNIVVTAPAVGTKELQHQQHQCDWLSKCYNIRKVAYTPFCGVVSVSLFLLLCCFVDWVIISLFCGVGSLPLLLCRIISVGGNNSISIKKKSDNRNNTKTATTATASAGMHGRLDSTQIYYVTTGMYRGITQACTSWPF